ncbi:hypothetical protein FPQ18DRAFT_308501 [Pyronema domesticum]|nr:hypothetical protein FPQ18DRAFT_308501 [Pyronema domesticum]
MSNNYYHIYRPLPTPPGEPNHRSLTTDTSGPIQVADPSLTLTVDPVHPANVQPGSYIQQPTMLHPSGIYDPHSLPVIQRLYPSQNPPYSDPQPNSQLQQTIGNPNVMLNSQARAFVQPRLIQNMDNTPASIASLASRHILGNTGTGNTTTLPISVSAPTQRVNAIVTTTTPPVTPKNMSSTSVNLTIFGYQIPINPEQVTAEAFPILQALQMISKDYDLSLTSGIAAEKRLAKGEIPFEKRKKYRRMFEILINYYYQMLFRFQLRSRNGTLFALMEHEGKSFRDDEKHMARMWDRVLGMVCWDHYMLAQQVMREGLLFEDWKRLDVARERQARVVLKALKDFCIAFTKETT